MVGNTRNTGTNVRVTRNMRKRKASASSQPDEETIDRQQVIDQHDKDQPRVKRITRPRKQNIVKETEPASVPHHGSSDPSPSSPNVRPSTSIANVVDDQTNSEVIDETESRREVSVETNNRRDHQITPSCRNCLTLNDRIGELQSLLRKERDEKASAYSRINELKTSVQMATQDKSNDRYCIANLREQNENLKAEAKKKERLVKSMEAAQTKSYSRKSGANREGRAGRNERVHKVIQKLHNDYRVVAEDVISYWSNRIHDDLFEMTISDDGQPVHEWLLNDNPSARVEYIDQPSSTAGKAIIEFTEGNGAVPKCPLALSKNGRLHTSKWESDRTFLKSIIKDVMNTSYKDMFSTDIPEAEEESEYTKAVNTITDTLLREFTLYKSNRASDWKKRVKCAFFSELGYIALGRIGSNKGETSKKNEERPVVAKNLVSVKPNGDVDCTWWRKAKFEDLRFSSDVTIPEVFQSDELFNNVAALKAFQEFRGYRHGENENAKEATVLCLARADAFFTTVIKFAQQPQKRGGRTGEMYNDEIKTLLPRACHELLASCRSILKRHNPEELSVLPVSAEGNPSNKFAVQRRSTSIFVMPSNGLLYVAITPEFFKKNISESLGDVLDCYVGNVKGDGNVFEDITDNNHVEEPGNRSEVRSMDNLTTESEKEFSART